ncbi:winged helix-turn-helix transcriptional regulator [Kaistia granuli]|uniref:winged helix-turn-helix transcriptional regulator n=1 Tax=Kaistia granuli TaxID=363259 RepID=UPI00036091B1
MKDLVSTCPIEDVMRVLGGRWPTLLLYYLKDGTKRFSDLQRDNPTVSQRILTLELRKLESAGLVQRTVFDGYPLRVEYALTATGRELFPMVDALGDWWEQVATARTRGDARPTRDSARAKSAPSPTKGEPSFPRNGSARPLQVGRAASGRPIG